METLATRLRQAMAARGIKLRKDLADMARVSPSAVTQWFNGDTGRMKADTVVALAKGLRVRLEWLKDGLGPMEDRENTDDDASPFPTLRTILAWEHEEDLPEGEYVFVPRLDVKLSAGNGAEQIELELVKEKPQAFRADWIRREKLKPSKLACMKAHGDSMETHIYEGDDLLIDTSQTTVIDGKVYALWYDGGERVKRLFRMPNGGLMVKSDNEAKYPPFTINGEQTNSVRIIGRVVLKSGSGGL